MPLQVAVTRFPGMKRGTNHNVGEFQPLKFWHTSGSQSAGSAEMVDVLPVLPFVDRA